MPNIKSAKKRLRQNAKRRANNRARMSALRTQVKRMEEAVAKGDRETAEAMLSTASRAFDQAAARGLIKKNTAARRKSQLATKVNGIGASE